jgi:hypothetical protein
VNYPYKLKTQIKFDGSFTDNVEENFFLPEERIDKGITKSKAITRRKVVKNYIDWLMSNGKQYADEQLQKTSYKQEEKENIKLIAAYQLGFEDDTIRRLDANQNQQLNRLFENSALTEEDKKQFLLDANQQRKETLTEKLQEIAENPKAYRKQRNFVKRKIDEDIEELQRAEFKGKIISNNNAEFNANMIKAPKRYNKYDRNTLGLQKPNRSLINKRMNKIENSNLNKLSQRRKALRYLGNFR